METVFTVFFEEPFWIGVIEEYANGKLSVCRITFGAEPTDAEIYEFIIRYYNHLKFSKPIKSRVRKTADNPKRRQREIRKQMKNTGIGTKSQQALKLQYEENKIERKQMNKEQREAEKVRRFALKQQKKKEKHKGH
ncbi:MAG: YjdF family protein [Eubacterium sp.]|nr:YjdF family protein [Eubacterium sp.]